MPHNNPQKPKIILFDHAEKTVQSGGKQYLVITDHAGEQHKISEKRQPLWAQFENATKHEGFVIIYENYLNADYVADAYSVASKLEDNLLRRAITEVVLSLGDQQTEERNRSIALSYSITLASTKVIPMTDLYTNAYSNYIFVKGQWKPPVKESEK